MLLFEDVVEQRGFPGAKETGKDGDGNGLHGILEFRFQTGKVCALRAKQVNSHGSLTARSLVSIEIRN
jgi:hypothetical protein